MLRNYEKLGLIEPYHKGDYTYRMYDENAVLRLQQIIILRKLRISLKNTAIVLRDENQAQTMKILNDNIAELCEEISAPDKIKNILKVLVERLEQSISQKIQYNILEDEDINEVVTILTLSKKALKESVNMSEMSKANQVLKHDLNVRIILLPSFTAASYQYIGEYSEEYL